MSSESENQFVEVMSLITHMYKQTAVAKVKRVQNPQDVYFSFHVALIV